MQDTRGLLGTASHTPAAAFDAAMRSYVRYRSDAVDRLQEAIACDPEAPLPHVLQAAFILFANRQDLVPAASRAVAVAERLAARGTARERAHAAAVTAWTRDAVPDALAIWEDILADHPHDLLAFRLHHHNAFWTGRKDRMLRATTRAVAAWSPSLRDWPIVLGCHAFACEEAGDYAGAEAFGRRAVDLAPDDLWSVHAVSHVLEMQGRVSEGIAWIESHHAALEHGNSLRHHLLWHQALHHAEMRDWDTVLRLYDRGFRDLDGALTRLQPDLATDVQNAASMLFRLERMGVDVGGRWNELADKAERRIGDCRSAFTLPHWMMALTAAGRMGAARRMLDAMHVFVEAGTGHNAIAVSRAAIPACTALLRLAEGSPEAAVATLRPALDALVVLGGSHAQHDVLEQVFLEAALRAGSTADIRLALDRAAGRYRASPHGRVAYSR